MIFIFIFVANRRNRPPPGILPIPAYGFHLPAQSFQYSNTMPTIIYPSPIFGPVKSRRLGISLGINLLPPDGKICTFDCLYCECGFNAEKRTTTPLPSRKEVSTALENKLIEMSREGQLPDVLTFAGNGEPTIHPQFGEIIDDTIILRNKYCPGAKVSVLTNATLITREKVFNALSKVDNNILKLDTVDTDYIMSVDRPTGSYDLASIVERMKAFNGTAVIQTMFMKGSVNGRNVDNTGDKYVIPWLEIIREIAPREVMIYTIDRETPHAGLQKATKEELDRIVSLLHSSGIKASASY